MMLKTAVALELEPHVLRKRCDPNSLAFETTDELPDLTEVIGQPRAFRALELGSEVTGPGYNTFVLGLPGSGRTTLSIEYLQRRATHQPKPDDWCYVNNFDNPRRPKALCLPAGLGAQLREDLRGLITRCQAEIPRLFESEEYTQERDRLMADLKKNQETEFLRLQEHVEKFNFVIARTPFGFVLAPAVSGKPLQPEELEKLSSAQREKLVQLQARLSEEVEKAINRLREMEIVTREAIDHLSERTVLFLISPFMKTMEDRYAGLPAVVSYLQTVQTDLVSHTDHFRSNEATSSIEPAVRAARMEWMRRYEVNLLVSQIEGEGAPVILETQPSYNNLIGRIEHEVSMGLARTDFTLIQAGALHRANGGYLVLPARDLLSNPYAWEGLKRVLRDLELRIVELANQLGLVPSVTLEPEPIPLQIKIVLVGTPILYYLLRMYDEDFAKLFKVRAEFAATMERNPQTEHEYSLFIKSVVNDNNLHPFDRSAVAAIIEYSSRLAEDQSKLSTRFGKIADLVREAAYWARVEAKASDGDLVLVTGSAVQQAIRESIFRSDLLEERLQEMITNGTIRIDVMGEAVGQINALSVLQLGDYAFGRPSRVTAAVFPGRGGVIDIERQAKLGGPIHTKGVLILSGLLGQFFGQDHPLSITASLTFEQSYEGVEGDSASAAEYLALLSAIAGVPLRQDRAITGSINQRGQIQAVGGVNEKIEGFFYTCRQRGLTGEQGVIIPASNTSHLMLSEEVVLAVSGGRFHIWAAETLDDGLRALTQLDLGSLQPDSSYPEGSFYQRVKSRLQAYTKSVERTGKAAEQKSLENNDSNHTSDNLT